MITFAAPAFLLAGALLALVPLALHMLARTPPERRPLPTARFLTVDRRTQLRVRRPGDLLLLALRMVFIVLLGAAFARPEWLPERSGTGAVVLLDAGAAMAPVWDEAVAAAGDRLGAAGTLVVFDSTARVLTDPDAALDSLRAAGPTGAPAGYLTALRGLKAAAGALPAESATAVLVTRPRWSAWSPGVTAGREAAWRARIDVVAMEGRPRGERTGVRADGGASGVEAPGSQAEGPTEPDAGMVGAVLGPDDHPLRPYATAALRALGYAPASDTATGLADTVPGLSETVPGLVVILSDAGAAAARLVGEAPNIVFLGGPMAGRGVPEGAVFWTVTPEPSNASPARDRLVLPGGRAMGGWAPRDGAPTDGSTVVAVWEDGRPAAAALRTGESCTAYLAAEPVEASAAADPTFPWLLRALATACTATGPRIEDRGSRIGNRGSGIEDRGSGIEDGGSMGRLGDLPLDRGALTILRGDAFPATLDLLAAEGPRRRSLARLLMVLALLVAVAEAALAYVRRGAP